MITKEAAAQVLSQKLVLLVIGLAAGSGILIPASYGSFHPVTSSEIQDGTIQSIDIGTGQVKAADIATDAVGAAEIEGVTKLLFGRCLPTNSQATTANPPGTMVTIQCAITGTDAGDIAVATLNDNHGCYKVARAQPLTNSVHVLVVNDCESATTSMGLSTSVAVIVFDK